MFQIYVPGPQEARPRQEETDDIGAEAGGADRGHLGHRSGESAIHCAATDLSLLLIDPGEQTTVKKLCTTLARAGLDSLPVFPVDVEKMGRVREMLNIARKLGRELRGEWRH